MLYIEKKGHCTQGFKPPIMYGTADGFKTPHTYGQPPQGSTVFSVYILRCPKACHSKGLRTPLSPLIPQNNY